MIYIYNCYGGTHTSSLASAIHLGRLPLERIPTKQEILNTDYFNKLGYKDMGRFVYRGTDSEGDKVFTLGRGLSKVVTPAVENLVRLFYDEFGVNGRIIMSNMSPTVPPALTIGGFLSRGLGIRFLGEPLLVLGARQAYKKIVELVLLTKKSARSMNGPILVLNNEKT